MILSIKSHEPLSISRSSPSTHLLAPQLLFHVLLITAATGESLLAATTGGM